MSEFHFTEAWNNFKLFYAPVCESTSALVRSLLPTYDVTGPVAVYSFHQTAGRGQGSNTWASNPGENVALTLALELNDNYTNVIPLNKAITICVADALGKLVTEETTIKWPNDIMLHNRKCCGLLLETTRERGRHFLLAGIGVNVNQKTWPEDFKAISLAEGTGTKLELLDVIHEIIYFISYNIKGIDKLNIPKINEDFNQRLWQKGEHVTLDLENGHHIQAKLLEVDDEGRLVFEDKDNKIKHLHHGQVRISKNNHNFFKG